LIATLTPWTSEAFTEVPGVSVIEVRHGRISRDVDYYDAATIMKQVGKLGSA
jgi:ketosteroid isomerase-like protein